MIGTSELLLIAALVLLLFGGKKLPELMKGLGKGVRSFKDGMKEDANAEDSNTIHQRNELNTTDNCHKGKKSQADDK